MAKRRGNSEGTITQRNDGRWEARMSLSDGKRKSFYGKTQGEALKKLKTAQRDVDNGLPVVADRQTVEQYLLSWLESVKHQIKLSTWRRYEFAVRLHIIPTLGRIVLSKLTPQQVQGLYSKLIDEGLASGTVIHLHLTFHRALKDAFRLGFVHRNVTELVHRPRKQRHEMQTFDEHQVASFLHAAEGERLEALFVLAVTTGMRQGELLALRWQDVDIDKGLVQIRYSLMYSPGKLVLVEPKTEQSRRKIHLTKVAVSALRKRRVQYLQEALLHGTEWNSNELVFPTQNGNPLYAKDLVYRYFQRVLNRAELPKIRFHDLRHTAATLMLERGVNVKVVSEILGHSDISVTLGIYNHVTPRMQQTAVEVMDAIFE